MENRKSMRIFLLTFGILFLTSILLLLILAKQHTHKTELPDDMRLTAEHAGGQEEKMPAQIENSSGQELHEKKEEVAKKREEAEALRQTSGAVGRYQYELRNVSGYLEVYVYQTDQLFMQTGIPYDTLSEAQKKELDEGKYFKNEQELYGYLESCTS